MNLPARNTLVQLLTMFSSQSLRLRLRATMHGVTGSRTDRRMDGRTDNMIMPIADHTG